MSISLGHQETRRIMGVTGTITVHAVDPVTLTRTGHGMLAELENRWSRFLPESDISRLNNSGGRRIHVDSTTVDLLRLMKTAHTATYGRFNPALLPLQHDMGDVHSLDGRNHCELPSSAHPFADLDALEICDGETVRMPSGMAIDAGGIGKGFAADLVAEELLRLGAASVSVNIGGDARVASQPEHPHDWNFDVVDATEGPVVSVVSLRNGAIATSSMNARHRNGAGPERHLMSLSPASDGPRTVSVISGQGRWAEVWTKYFFFADSWSDAVSRAEMPVLAVGTDNTLVTSARWKEFEL